MPTPTAGRGITKNQATAPHAMNSSKEGANGAFVVPLVHISVPESVVNLGFWGALVGTAALGAIDWPLVALIGAGVLVARHHNSS